MRNNLPPNSSHVVLSLAFRDWDQHLSVSCCKCWQSRQKKPPLLSCTQRIGSRFECSGPPGHAFLLTCFDRAVGIRLARWLDLDHRWGNSCRLAKCRFNHPGPMRIKIGSSGRCRHPDITPQPILPATTRGTDLNGGRCAERGMRVFLRREEPMNCAGLWRRG
jgi:hypothetical protein